MHRGLLLTVVLFGMVLSRPSMQRIVINNHIWEVPNEPGWEQVLEDVVSIQHSLGKCVTVADCRQIINELRAVFFRHAVSRKYLEANTPYARDVIGSIFKWG